MAKGETSEIAHFTEASTRLSVPLGQWVHIGEIAGESNAVRGAILKNDSEKQNIFFPFSLKMEGY